jgi:hypothetical protein
VTRKVSTVRFFTATKLLEESKPPTQLFLLPYSLFYTNAVRDKTYGTFKGGLDLKYRN